MDYLFNIKIYIYLFVLFRFRQLNNFLLKQIEQYLVLLDEIIEIELRQVQNRFQSKRQLTFEAIKSKTTNTKVIINSSFCLLLLFD